MTDPVRGLSDLFELVVKLTDALYNESPRSLAEQQHVQSVLIPKLREEITEAITDNLSEMETEVLRDCLGDLCGDPEDI